MEHLNEEVLKNEILNELSNFNSSGILFDSIEYKSSEGLESFIDEMTNEQARICIVEAIKFAYSKGCFNLQESEVISKSLRVFNK